MFKSGNSFQKIINFNLFSGTIECEVKFSIDDAIFIISIIFNTFVTSYI